MTKCPKCNRNMYNSIVSVAGIEEPCLVCEDCDMVFLHEEIEKEW